MRTSILRRGLAVAAIAVAATAALSACSTPKVAEGTVHVQIGNGAETVQNSGYTVTGTGKPIEVQVNKAKVSVSCSGTEDVTIVGADGTVDLTGTCGDVSVTSANQTITTASVKALKVLGASNTITTGDVGSMRITGADNTVTYASTASAPELLGAANTVTEK